MHALLRKAMENAENGEQSTNLVGRVAKTTQCWWITIHTNPAAPLLLRKHNQLHTKSTKRAHLTKSTKPSVCSVSDTNTIGYFQQWVETVEIVSDKAYLKDFFIKYSSSKHDNSFGIDDGVGASEQLLGGLLFTVQNEGDGLLVHTDGHSMPPGRGGDVNSHTYWVTRCPLTHRWQVKRLFCVWLLHEIQIKAILAK